MINYKEQYKQLQFDLVGTENSDGQVVYNGIPAKKATFKAGLEVPIHRWFRLTPSFGPDLVIEMLNTMECGADDVVLDPFSGAGTTLIECQINRISSFGYEINPLLYFVCKTSLNWNLAPTQLDATLSEVEHRYTELNKQFDEHDLENGSLRVPPIHDPFRWWRKDVLKEALCVKLAIQQSTALQEVKDFFLLGLAGILVPDLTNVTLGRLQLHFIDRSNEAIDVWTIFYRHARMMINDLFRIVGSGARSGSQVYHADSTSINLPGPERLASLVITSPPYPNRYSYVWNTRPHLYFLDFFNNPKQASDLDKQTIGGTWGTATSALIKGAVKPENLTIKQNISPIAEEIRQSDNLMANYLIKYFNLLARQIVAMEPVLQSHAKLAYVVGCSRLKGTYVETDVLLAKVIEGLGLGYRVMSVERIRRRHSDKDLHESIVYARK
jgi:hypothetical protein